MHVFRATKDANLEGWVSGARCFKWVPYIDVLARDMAENNTSNNNLGAYKQGDDKFVGNNPPSG